MGNKSREVNLTIDSRIISHLGEALIENEKIALLELIKNASDADANNCNIVIDTFYESEYGQGRILIEDDGNGMTPFIIENAFLKIATSFKSDHQKVSPKFKRQAQGNKGIGRLSLNQLGRFVSVDTKVDTSLCDYFSNEELKEHLGYDTKDMFLESNNEYFYHIDIDWEKYSNSIGSIESVKLELEKNKFNESIFAHKKSHGTKIEVLGLKGIDFWKSTKTAREIEQDVLEFLNPYIDEQFNFYVKINLDNNKFVSNKYDLNDIENNFFSKVEFAFDNKSCMISMDITRSKKYIEYKIDGLVKDLNRWNMKLIGEKSIKKSYDKYIHEKIEFDLTNLNTANRTAPNIKFDQFQTYYENVLIDREESVDSGVKFYLPGDFRGAIYGFDLSADSPIDRAFKKVLSEIKGVKLYRNNFRIFPYGIKNNDWLDMSDFNQRDKGVVYKQHSSTGFINIDGVENLDRLKELTNRQGLVLDNYGTNFILLVKEIIFKSAARRDKDFREYFSFNRKAIENLESNDIIEISGMRFQKKVDVIKELENKTKEFLDNFDKLEDKERKDETRSIYQYATNIRSEVSLQKDQVVEQEQHLKEFIPIMGATIISETLSHEIIRLSNNIKTYSINARVSVNKDDKDEVLNNLSRIDSSNKFLLRYASLLDVNSYSRRRRYSIESIFNVLENILNDSPLLTYGNTTLKYNIIGEDFKAKIIEDSFKIVIENMIINSTYWLNKFNITSPNIKFELNNELDKLTIYDNGIGIDKSVENNLFTEFVTNKPPEDGRGMGLYIVKTLLNEIGADIKLKQERNQYGNLFKFVITFPNVEE